MKTKRITIPITGNLDALRKQLQDDHGVEFTYTQTIDFLINFYRKRTQQPKTEWRKVDAPG